MSYMWACRRPPAPKLLDPVTQSGVVGLSDAVIIEGLSLGMADFRGSIMRLRAECGKPPTARLAAAASDTVAASRSLCPERMVSYKATRSSMRILELENRCRETRARLTL